MRSCYTSTRELRRGVTKLAKQQRRRRRRQGLPRSRAEILEDAYLASRGLTGHGTSAELTALQASGRDVLEASFQSIYDTLRLEVQRSHYAGDGVISEVLSDEESLSAGEEDDDDADVVTAASAANGQSTSSTVKAEPPPEKRLKLESK